MAWRFYARRTVSGLWLDTDVQMRATVTTELNGPGSVVATIPPKFDVETASDGNPMWWERGTTLYAEDSRQLVAVGLLSFSRPTAEGRAIEVPGLSSAYDLIGFEGHLREWDANPYDLVRSLVDDAHRQPDGDVGLVVRSEGQPPERAGDKRPPDAPVKPKRQRGETVKHHEDQVASWEDKQAKWEEEYGERTPYTLAWWESQYVGAEIAELADECRFDFREAHRWVDRDALDARHNLVLEPRRQVRRDDLALVAGENLYGTLEPETDLEAYGNNVIVLGAGEGRKMKRGQHGRRDGRVRTTRFDDSKAMKNANRLQQRAVRLHSRAEVVTTLPEATVPDDVAASVRLGDELRVRSSMFTGWCRVVSISRDTGGGDATLRFDGGDE